MRRIGCLLALLLLCGCAKKEPPVVRLPAVTVKSTVAAQTIPTHPISTQPPATTEETIPPLVLNLTMEEKRMLLKLGMAELGETQCSTCMAMVMRTVINRVASEKFGSSIHSVVHAPDQFTPVMDGSYDKAKPNDACFSALNMVLRGWDETQGALYYEFCEGESWHSRNLQLLTSHCNTRFYR